MTACSKHPGTQAGAELRELLAECERVLKQVDDLQREELDQFELVDRLAQQLDAETVKQVGDALSKLRLELRSA